MRDGISRIADGLLAVLLAPACVACGEPLDHPWRELACDRCWAAVRPLVPPLCAVCGDPLTTWRSVPVDERCSRCRGAAGCITRGRALGVYDGPLRSILHALKYDGRRTLAPRLSALMRMHGSWVLEGADVCVPVPLHWRRQWQRGFNQASDLAAGLGLPVVHALRRPRRARSQTDLPADERRANVRNAFRVRRRACIVGACAVVVDDVSTTGATLDACARVLVGAGAREVRTLTAARVVTRPPDARPR